MRRYWFDGKVSDTVFIQGEEFHHIFGVCRQQVGSKFELLIPGGFALFVIVEAVEKKQARCRVLEQRAVAALRTPHIHLVMSIPRYAVLDAVVEKAVELGVHSIIPVYSDFSFIHRDFPQVKMERLQKIIKSAMQQSGRGEWMQIQEPRLLDDFLKSINPNPQWMGLFAYEGTAERTLQDCTISKGLDGVWLFVGGEGGYSSREVGLFQKMGMAPVTLGEQVLRVETACIALLSVLKYQLDLWR